MFITLEGPDGSGKSTAALWLADRLASLGVPVVAAREPGGTSVGEAVRRILLGDSPPASQMASLLLFNAARAELVQTTIRPALKSGHTVICDRFTDSTLAYQGYGGGLPLEAVRTVNSLASGGLVPDITVLLDLDVELGLARKAASDEWNAMDACSVAFHRRVRTGFLALAAQEPDRWTVIDASQALDQIQMQLERCVLARNVYDPTTGGQEHSR